MKFFLLQNLFILGEFIQQKIDHTRFFLLENDKIVACYSIHALRAAYRKQHRPQNVEDYNVKIVDSLTNLVLKLASKSHKMRKRLLEYGKMLICIENTIPKSTVNRDVINMVSHNVVSILRRLPGIQQYLWELKPVSFF